MQRSDLIELFVEVAEALDAAHVELSTLNETGLPVPDAIEQLVHEHAAMKGTLARLPAELRERAKAMYREEWNRGRPDPPSLPVPVLREVLAQLEEVEETLRRRRLVEPGLDEAMRGGVYRSDFAGC